MLATLLDKLKYAMRTPTCHACPSEIGPGEAFCRPCLERLSLRDPAPLLIAGKFELHAATLFNPMLKHRLYGYKFYGKQQHAEMLADLMALYAEKSGLQKNLILTTVPAHEQRPEHLAPVAQILAERLQAPYQPGLLQWTRSVTPQHTIHSKRKRLENLQGSLEATRLTARAQGKTILLIDDLTTTGATLLEASRALHRAGLTDVKGLALTYVPLAFQRQLQAATPAGATP